MPPDLPLNIYRGKTFSFSLLYGEEIIIYKPITAMPIKAPVTLTVVDHGLPESWPVLINCVKTPQELNTEYAVVAKRVDDDTIEINEMNALCWKDFVASGVCVFNKPADLTGWDCRATVKNKIGGDVLFTWHSDPTEDPDGEIVVDDENSTFTLKIDASTTASLDWRVGVYDIEGITPAGEVIPICRISSVTVHDEVTT